MNETERQAWINMIDLLASIGGIALFAAGFSVVNTILLACLLFGRKTK
jgi:hypothetical protein